MYQEKIIKGYPNYKVDTLGNVYGKSICQKNIKGEWRKIYGTFVKGYLKCKIRNENGVKLVFAHRLVAESFIENIHNKPTVNHINCDKSDNRVENLEWATQKEQIKHADYHGLIKRDLIGVKKRKSFKQYSLDGIFIKDCIGIENVATELGVSPTAISQNLRNISKSCCGFKFQYN